MYRVLIVDDEEPVLDSYEFMLKSTADFSLAGKARTGYEALALIYELEPDLVFMDINIPGLDGLEVIGEVRKKFAPMVFILSTAYERFDLAQRAIPLGVFAYLVKPVSKKTFFSTLDTVREALENRVTEEGPQGDDEPERQFLRKTIWKEISPEDWERCRERFNLSSDKGIVLLVELDQDTELWCKKIAEQLSFRHHCRYDVMLNRGLFLILEDMGRDTLDGQVTVILRDIKLPEGSCYYGIGEVRPGQLLYQSCNGALRELQNRLNRTDMLLRERMRIIQIRHKIGIAGAEEVKKLFRSLWEEVFTYCDFTLAKAKMAALFTLLIDDCTGCYGAHSEEDPPLNPAEEILPLRGLAEWETWASDAFGRLLFRATLYRSGSFPMPLSKAIEYIHEHQTEGIQLSSVAEAAQVSSAYLSRLFSEHLKTNFVDYLTELRMEKAEKLILEGKMNVKEVAFAVGYQDPNYFSKIFKKTTGVLPTGYAAEKRGEG
ncbi:response regulator transcription factor [Treponema primitia]|uniref:response regulator transcription factor n=1 Tax=Treponema primitia TaxID=88058 RepID=UPI000474E2B6|nr:helix-turn-helix domain-containing protein [Treponema primitia]